MFDFSVSVQSCSEKDKYYLVYYNELCDKDCRTGYCNKYKILYITQNTIKSVICKHIHAVVAMFEVRSKYVSGSGNIDMSDKNDILYIDQPSSSQLHYQNDVTNFIQENSVKQEHKPLNFDERREVEALKYIIIIFLTIKFIGHDGKRL
ncbi:hypothetical protein NQ315_013541 [Exocentrus adspersus]|uniref:SWIM-type domain-containing protein n=1 Tax=Exocentrus adspersus TaxID=1586481 RepID=A0AAV8VBC5_9CUCU|nr:hypothetical protein NQ315_013541 [Exocentrus adspersus]